MSIEFNIESKLKTDLTAILSPVYEVRVISENQAIEDANFCVVSCTIGGSQEGFSDLLRVDCDIALNRYFADTQDPSLELLQDVQTVRDVITQSRDVVFADNSRVLGVIIEEGSALNIEDGFAGYNIKSAFYCQLNNNGSHPEEADAESKTNPELVDQSTGAESKTNPELVERSTDVDSKTNPILTDKSSNVDAKTNPALSNISGSPTNKTFPNLSDKSRDVNEKLNPALSDKSTDVSEKATPALVEKSVEVEVKEAPVLIEKTTTAPRNAGLVFGISEDMGTLFGTSIQEISVKKNYQTNVIYYPDGSINEICLYGGVQHVQVKKHVFEPDVNTPDLGEIVTVGGVDCITFDRVAGTQNQNYRLDTIQLIGKLPTTTTEGA